MATRQTQVRFLLLLIRRRYEVLFFRDQRITAVVLRLVTETEVLCEAVKTEVGRRHILAAKRARKLVQSEFKIEVLTLR